jgi:hypothetical protein
VKSGPIAAEPEETWSGVNAALSVGQRGLPGGSSLAQLLERERGVPNLNFPPRLTVAQVLAAADAHRARTGRWPTMESGPVPELKVDSWRHIYVALIKGRRGLPKGLSLPKLLAKHRDYVDPRIGVPRRNSEE